MKSERLLYKKIESVDIEFIYKGLSDPELTKHYGVHFRTLEETQEQMKWYENLVEEDEGIWFKVQHTESGNWIGASGFNDWNHQNKTAEIGCWILPEFWGKGLGTEVMEWIIGYGFQNMDLIAIEGFVDSKNEAIKKVLKKFKFEHFNTTDERDLKNGKLISVDHFRLIKK